MCMFMYTMKIQKKKKNVISNELHNIKVKYHINKYFNAQKSSL